MNIGFAIRTRYDFRREYVVSKTNELNWANYLNECKYQKINTKKNLRLLHRTTAIPGQQTFGMSDQQKYSIEMYFDHTKISKENFEFIVRTESKCAAFYIHLIATPVKPDEPVFTLSVSEVRFYCFLLQYIFAFMSSSKDLETFLHSKSAGKIIEKNRAENTNLNEADRKTLIALSYQYLTEKCLKVERSHIITVAKMLVFLVPTLQDLTKGEHAGYVSLLICSLEFHYLNKLYIYFRM